MLPAAFAAAAPVRHIGTVRHTGAPTPWYSARVSTRAILQAAGSAG
jgi:hypothetical protein